MKLGVTSTSMIQECHCNDIKSVVSNNEKFVLYHYLLFRINNNITFLLDLFDWVQE